MISTLAVDGWIGRARAVVRVAATGLALVACLLAPARAATHNEFTLKASHAIVMDAGSGAVLFQYNADVAIPPTGLAKLMTVATVFRALKAGERHLTDELNMSEHAWRTGGAPSRTPAMMVPLNTRTSIADLLRGVIVEGGNDAAIALGEGLGGTEIGFARKMEAEGRRIGLAKATFRNATGTPNPEQLITVRELASLARYIVSEYPDYYPLFAEKTLNYRNHKFVNHNALLFLNNGTDGLFAASVGRSNYSLVASAVEDGHRLIVVVMGLASENDRRDEAKKLFDWGFHAFGEFKLFEAGETVGTARVWGGEKMSVPLIGNGEVSVVLPRFPANQKLRGEIVYQGPLKAPVRKGDQVALLRVTSTAEATAEVPLFAAEDIAPAGKLKRGLETIYIYATSWLP